MNQETECRNLISCFSFLRVLAAVDRPDPLQLFLRLSPSPGQTADPAAAAAERDQPDRLQRGLQLPVLHAGPQ